MRDKIITGFAAFFSMASYLTTPVLAGADDPIKVVVSLNDQSLRVYRGSEHIASSNISSGKKGHATPTGIFSILQKNRHHRSNIYSGAPMPFMQRLTWSGIALHASKSVPRRPASHGCVRLPHNFANKLFRMATNGMHVIIEDDPLAPQKVSHEALFQPQKTWSANKEYDPWVNAHIEMSNVGYIETDHRYPARIFITRRTHKEDLIAAQELLNKLGYDPGVVDGIMGPATWAAVSAYREANGLEGNGTVDNELLTHIYTKLGKTRPANGRMLVRKHHKTVFETEVHIDQAERPLGSHLLTVENYNADAGKTEWNNVTLLDRVQTKIHLNSGEQVSDETSRFDAMSALSRIQMSKHDRHQIERLLSPKSSITISDNGMSIETGAKGTDFIVLSDPKPGLAQIASENNGNSG